MKSILKMIFLAAVLQAPVAIADTFTGNDLIAFSSFEKLLYIAGVAEAGNYCFPKGIVTYGQSRAIVEKYMADHPELWNKPAINIVLWSFNWAFCPTKIKPATN